MIIMATARKTTTATTDTGTIKVLRKEYTMTSKNAFVIPEEEAKDIVSRGRKAKDSIYLHDVKEAAKTPGKMFGIRPEKDQKVTTILSQLRAAGKQLGVKLSIHDRVEARGYVGFVVLPEPPATDAA